ncbi:hypothetical protein [Rhizobium rhizogenes]|uniref:hypothetical protein n=1 Tax=Rhizobium rhizogenes TaxID=359 RepID=UPI0015743761|nr:hypothetical protein [Rhizobium rhizogenes]NTH23008.1 hypothetical protein [Rhizobium rhizogenes]NTH36038.1 hypothetical protein [Rhizobium rhizogenes]
MSENARTTVVLSAPHIGLSKNSARDFALDQFAGQQGYESFAELFVYCFDQALQISGEARESDSIDVASNGQDFSGLPSKTFWIRSSRSSSKN